MEGGAARAPDSARTGHDRAKPVRSTAGITLFSLYWGQSRSALQLANYAWPFQRDFMLGILITLIHIVVCFFLIIVVLLQSGQAADLAGAFGGMGSQTAFGPRGSATLLSKATTLAAAIFMVTSLTLAILATRGAASSGSVLERQKAAPAKTTAPATSTPKVPAVPLQNAPNQAPAPAPANPANKK